MNFSITHVRSLKNLIILTGQSEDVLNTYRNKLALGGRCDGLLDFAAMKMGLIQWTLSVLSQ